MAHLISNMLTDYIQFIQHIFNYSVSLPTAALWLPPWLVAPWLYPCSGFCLISLRHILLSAAAGFRRHAVGSHWPLRCCCRVFRQLHFHLHPKNAHTKINPFCYNFRHQQMHQNGKKLPIWKSSTTGGFSNRALGQWMTNILSWSTCAWILGTADRLTAITNTR